MSQTEKFDRGLLSAVLPRWLCIWLMTCAVMVFLSLLNPVVPVLGVLGFFAPLHMLGFIMLGVAVLRMGA